MMSLSLEGAFSILLLTLSYKIYRAKIKSHSGCCLKKDGTGNGIIIDTQNSGINDDNNILDKL